MPWHPKRRGRALVSSGRVSFLGGRDEAEESGGRSQRSRVQMIRARGCQFVTLMQGVEWREGDMRTHVLLHRVWTAPRKWLEDHKTGWNMCEWVFTSSTFFGQAPQLLTVGDEGLSPSFAWTGGV